MNLKEVSVPSIYLSSPDFKFFRDWFVNALTKIHYDTEHFFDLIDPLRCPKDLLWLLADTMGFKFDDRLPTAYNRLVLLYFVTMIRNRGSRDGVALAAEVNLAQFSVINYGEEKEILYNRLEDTSVPVNSVYVQPHTADGYIDVIYFSTRIPTDACIEYVRPLGMYCFQHAGVKYDGKTKVSIDARLTDTRELGESIGPTHIAHYSREDYARAQKQKPYSNEVDYNHTRKAVFYRNGVYETANNIKYGINPGLRALYSLQLCNNEHIVESLLQPIFGMGFNPQISTVYGDDYVVPEFEPQAKPYNLRYDRTFEESITPDVYTAEPGSTQLNPMPKVNPPMFAVGEAIPMDNTNTKYTKLQNGEIVVADS
jgi:hypothetical protein